MRFWKKRSRGARNRRDSDSIVAAFSVGPFATPPGPFIGIGELSMENARCCTGNIAKRIGVNAAFGEIRRETKILFAGRTLPDRSGADE